jgi:hypothetical protein
MNPTMTTISAGSASRAGSMTITVRERATWPVRCGVTLYTSVVRTVYQPSPSQDDQCTGTSHVSPDGSRWGFSQMDAGRGATCR